MTQGTKNNRGRLILVALILVLGAFWVGARYGPKQAEKVEARRIAAVQPGLSADRGRIHQRAHLPPGIAGCGQYFDEGHGVRFLHGSRAGGRRRLGICY